MLKICKVCGQYKEESEFPNYGSDKYPQLNRFEEQ